jgi:hypothetical protein
MINMSEEVRRLPLPEEGRAWRRVVDTSLAPPEDIVLEGVPVGDTYALAAHAVAVLEEKMGSEPFFSA